MDIRNFKKKKHDKKRFMSFFGIVLLLIIIFGPIKNYFSANPDDLAGTWELITGKQLHDYAKWDKIQFWWVLSVDNHFPVYTHIITRGSEKLGVKSVSTNLNDYLGNIEIVGKIVDNDKWMPIADVEIVKLAKPWLIIKWNTYLFIKDLLYLDFSEQSQLAANKSGKNMTIYFNKEPLFTIERFLCSKILKDKDCNSIIESYLRSQKEFFMSDQWYSFYKHADKTRAVFDGNIFGYMFKNVEDTTILDISNMVKIVNKDFIVNNKKDLIYQTCANDDDVAQNITFSKAWFNDPYYLTITVEGDTEHKEKYECYITFDLRNERKITDSAFTIK